MMAALAVMFWAGNAAPGISHINLENGARGARPALWMISDKDTAIYLFGTTHALPKNFDWRTPKFNALAMAADELVLEATEDQVSSRADQLAMQAIMNRAAQLPPLAARVPAAKRDKLLAAMNQSATSRSNFNDMPTWMASFVLTSEDMERSGLSQASGVEAALEAQFRTLKKRVTAVDNGARTFKRLDTMSPQAQTRMLADVLDDLGDPNGEAAASDKAWAEGNVGLLAKHFTEGELGTELFDILVRKRNQAWVDWLEMRMKKPGHILFAVGAGHMAGPESVIAMLAKQGFTAKRIQ